MKLLVLALILVGASALPQSRVKNPQEWRPASPLFGHQLKSRNLFANPRHVLAGSDKNDKTRFVKMTPAFYKPETKRPTDCGKENLSSTKIINGQKAEENQFPWVGYMRCSNPGWSCTGSLISEEWFLTAAHCTIDCLSFDITLGTNNWNNPGPNGVVISSTQAITHPGFNFFTIKDDVGLIKLPRKAPLSDAIRLSCLPAQNQLGDQHAGSIATLTGWGLTFDGQSQQPDELNFAPNRPIISNSKCEESYGNIDEGHICIDTDFNTGEGENIGVCSGDSGGPLNLQEGGGQYMQVGVASFVSGYGCESEDYPHVYARVTNYMQWISDNSGIPIEPTP
jgi:secreted trypsin-like serine protease